MSGAELAPPPTREEPGRYVGNVPILTGVRNPRSMPQVLFLVRAGVGARGTWREEGHDGGVDKGVRPARRVNTRLGGYRGKRCPSPPGRPSPLHSIPSRRCLTRSCSHVVHALPPAHPRAPHCSHVTCLSLAAQEDIPAFLTENSLSVEETLQALQTLFR